MKIVFSGFEWDDGNWPKCAKHGVTKEEIEEIFLVDGQNFIRPISTRYMHQREIDHYDQTCSQANAIAPK